MDRLADITRTQPQNRGEAIDFTRPHGTRAERREDGDVRAEERAHDRERVERTSEKPERFAAHLAEQQTSLEAPPATEQPETAAPEAEPAQDAAPDAEQAGSETATDPARTNATAPKRTGITVDAQLAPEIETAAPVLPVETGIAPQPEAARIATPAAPTAALPAAPAAPVSAVPAAKATDALAAEPAVAPTITAAPRVEAETRVLEAEASASKAGARPADGAAAQLQDPLAARESRTEAPQAVTPREAPAARSVEQLEHAADVLRQIRVQITPQMTEARIQLQPLELGRVSIHLSLENGRMKTTVRAEKTETLQAIQTHLPELRAALRQHGIDAREFQLSLGFENRPSRDGERAPSQSNTRQNAADVTAVERSPALHAALSKTGVDFYA
jgi:flagellar hook-length control protein FliK